MSESLTFRCPNDLAELVRSQAQATGKDKTSILVGMLRQSLLALPLEQKNNLPAIPAIYLVYQQDKLFYVGKTKNLKARWLNHHRLIQFLKAGEGVYIAWFPCDQEQLEVMEDAFIELLDPELNGESLADTGKALATFRTEREKWESFKTLCTANGTNASAVLNKYVNQCLANNQVNIEASSSTQPDNVEQLLDERITSQLDECLTAKLEERGLTAENIKERLEEHTAYLAQGLNMMIGELQAQLEELRGKLKAR